MIFSYQRKSRHIYCKKFIFTSKSRNSRETFLIITYRQCYSLNISASGSWRSQQDEHINVKQFINSEQSPKVKSTVKMKRNAAVFVIFAILLNVITDSALVREGLWKKSMFCEKFA